MQTQTATVRIADLNVSPRNVRFGSEPDPERVAGIADNIANVSLIHPLWIELVDEKPLVVAGKTRFRALQYLIADGRLNPDAMTECRVVASEHAQALSLSENLQREAMHPADEFRAFARLVEHGKTIEQVALAFGSSTQTVQRRLKLAAVAPELIDAYRASNSPTLEQLMALAITDDHGRQVAVWTERKAGPEWQRAAEQLRNALTADAVDAGSDRRTRLVSVAEYEAAGGAVDRDLFSDRVYLLDPALLDRLVNTKLSEAAARVQAEGWSWVEVLIDNPHDTLNRLGRTYAVPRTPTPEEAATIAALETAAVTTQGELEALYESDDASDDTQADAIEAAELAALRATEALDEAQSALGSAWTAEQLAFAGAAVLLEQNGHVVVRRGLVRKDDRRAMDDAARAGRGGSVQGGRTTQDGGRKADALSEALRFSLWGHRNLAAQSELATNARVAKILMAFWSVENACITERCSCPAPVDLTISCGSGSIRSRLHSLGTDVVARRETFERQCETVVAGLPKDPEALWDALAAMTDAELDALIAVGVARSLALAPEHSGITAKVLDALRFDMADHFVPTAANYLGRVAKPLILEALAEAGQGADDTLKAAKKGALVEAAAQRLAGSRWVPALIRSPAPSVPDVAKSKPAKAATKKPDSTQPKAVKKAAAPAAKAAPKKAVKKTR